MFITNVIAELGHASRERVEEVVNEARVAGKSPEALLRDYQVIDGDQLSRAIAERYGLDHVDLNVYKVDMGAANLLSMSAARRYRALPVGYVNTETLLLAMADPANVLAVDDIQMMTGLNCHVAVAAEEDIDALISRMSRLEHAVTDALQEEEEVEGEAEITELHETADDAPVIKLVHSILAQAVNEGASDIHFEPVEGEMRVRFRVDGVLYESARVPKRMIAGVVSRVKLMADMDIAEKRVPEAPVRLRGGLPGADLERDLGLLALANGSIAPIHPRYCFSRRGGTLRGDPPAPGRRKTLARDVGANSSARLIPGCG
jgi:type IV pilus assembly protein PilB